MGMESVLSGKTLYGFGDSLVCGHYLGIGMLDYVAEENGMIYTKYAINGGTVIPGIASQLDNAILVPDLAAQIEAASDQPPDFICFDGLTNDAYDLIIDQYLGVPSGNYDGEYDTDTFIGAFETVCFKLRKKYQDSSIFYVCTHKMPSRKQEPQELLQHWARKICRKWSIPYIDVYNRGGINTCISGMRYDYSYNLPGETVGGNGTHLNADGYRLWYAPMIETELKNAVRRKEVL